MENALRYESHIDLANENNAHTLQILLTGENKKVLEVGPAAGYITEALRERGCLVTCVEFDPEAAKVAAEFAERMIVGDIEKLDFADAFGDEKFDVVMFGDVLEHLVNPEAVLRKVHGLLAPGGYIVSSIPNVSHGSLRLALLDGKFNYTEIGLLDRTHLRFFTNESIAEMFHNTGFVVDELRRVKMDPFGVEVGVQEKDFPPYLVQALRADEEAMTYQIVVTAKPSAAPTNGKKTAAAKRAEAVGALWRARRRTPTDKRYRRQYRLARPEPRSAVRA
jgi:2-polyprenyl-3-methyl-5-hydroxy-6-metoxy-1,4-benzoquinol methylase